MNGRFHASDENRIVAEVSRELERLEVDPGLPPPPDFTDRVMAAVAHEPLPQPARAFGAAILAGRIRAAVAAVGDAGRVATRGFAPVAIRVQALALILVVAGLGVALAGGAAVGAINVLTSPSSPSQPVPSFVPSVSPSVGPTDSPSPSNAATAEPTDSASPPDTPEPTETVEPTHSDDHTGGGSPATLAPRTPEPTDDHGDSSGSGGSDSSGSSGSGSGDSGSSGSGGGGSTETPSATDGHSGSSDG
jgi:uncharacterized membrane protein YgcG